MSKQVHRYLVEKFDCGCLHLYDNPKGFSQKAHCAGRKKRK